MLLHYMDRYGTLAFAFVFGVGYAASVWGGRTEVAGQILAGVGIVGLLLKGLKDAMPESPEAIAAKAVRALCGDNPGQWPDAQATLLAHARPATSKLIAVVQSSGVRKDVSERALEAVGRIICEGPSVADRVDAVRALTEVRGDMATRTIMEALERAEPEVAGHIAVALAKKHSLGYLQDRLGRKPEVRLGTYALISVSLHDDPLGANILDQFARFVGTDLGPIAHSLKSAVGTTMKTEGLVRARGKLDAKGNLSREVRDAIDSVIAALEEV